MDGSGVFPAHLRRIRAFSAAAEDNPPLAGGGDLPGAHPGVWRSGAGGGVSEAPGALAATAAILLARFKTRPIPEICAMAGITLEDFTQSVAYKEIFGLGELDITLRQLRRRCGGLTPEQDAQIRALPRPRLEALAEALLDFQGSDDLNAWLAVG